MIVIMLCHGQWWDLRYLNFVATSMFYLLLIET